MSSEGSITRWFVELEGGNSAAAVALWECYFPQLVQFARERLRNVPRRAADEEDVALSAMDSFFDAAQQGRFPDLTDRHDLWRLLVQMTARKVVDFKRHETRQRRGGGRVRGQGDVNEGEMNDAALAQVVAETPTPEFAAIMAEECRRRLTQLTNPEHQAIAVAKMQGFTNQEVADQLNVSVSTVERRLRLIRKKWELEETP
ncbi:MAG: RNA polymerase subunit sigma-70 [Planctomycetes bacterium]|nr:RNA polymerase subunit sigma-70 [Planctomycetota bacterium]